MTRLEFQRNSCGTRREAAGCGADPAGGSEGRALAQVRGWGAGPDADWLGAALLDAGPTATASSLALLLPALSRSASSPQNPSSPLLR